MRDVVGESGGRQAPASRYILLAVSTAILSRVAVLAAAYERVTNGGDLRVGAAIRDVRYAEALHGVAGRVVDSLAHRDGVWFVRIAAGGYSHPHSTAFFPLYPLLMRGLSVATGGNYVVAGVVISLAAYAAAMVLLFMLVRPRFGVAVAAWSVAFISWFPTSFVFSAVYSESLFLLLTVAAFWFAARSRWWAAGLAGLLASLTRQNGVLLVLPLLLLYAEERGWGWRSVTLRWPRDLRLGSLLLVPLGTLLYMGYLQLSFGSALLFATDQANWKRTFGDPVVTVIHGMRDAVHAVERMGHLHSSLVASLHPGHPAQLLVVSSVAPAVALVAALVFVGLAARRLPLAYTVWAALGILSPLFYPSALAPLYSLHRFILVLFPVFIAVALVTERRAAVLRWPLLALSAAGLVWYAWVFAAFARIG
jgi:Mannosyltransferase (PIG-V)